MHRNPLWIGFLIIISSVTAFYSFKAALNLYDYNQLNASVLTSDVHFEVKQVALDAYAPIAHFKFGDSYHGIAEMTNNLAANPEYIQEKLKSLKPLKVYYSSKDPTIYSLEKEWPLGLVIRAALMIGLTLYFFWLGNKVKQIT